MKNNEQGFYWIETVVALLSVSLLLFSALHIYGAMSNQLGKTASDWELFWKMKKWTYAWKQGSIMAGQYQTDHYHVKIQERAISPTLTEGEIIFHWEAFDLPKEKKLYAYKMDMP